jgi:hypothetical protein
VPLDNFAEVIEFPAVRARKVTSPTVEEISDEVEAEQKRRITISSDRDQNRY